jgi:hypothetical protein
MVAINLQIADEHKPDEQNQDQDCDEAATLKVHYLRVLSVEHEMELI